jgi:two-component system, LytTR family, response regulator
MTKFSCIIVEDEKPAQELLKSYLAKTDWISLAGVFDDAVSALDFLRLHDIDLIFLDIQIPGLSGIEFLRSLRKSPQIIITSAYSEYAIDAFELDVRDYLKKPFSFERFLKAVNRITYSSTSAQVHSGTVATNPDQSFTFFNVNKTMVKVMFSQVRYIECMREYVYIHLEGEKIVTKISMTDIEKTLPQYFLRIHRSYLLNMNKITAYNAEEIFIDKTTFPIGTSYKKMVSMALSGNQVQKNLD